MPILKWVLPSVCPGGEGGQYGFHRHGHEFNAVRRNYCCQLEKRRVTVINFERNYRILNKLRSYAVEILSD
ncbi:hypothetical protein BN873_720022 [Candidatus Competibacter denitrificans Run_A_D11]|uniref:Uncharacterized protein n=1 Tax=Candidatus Competibacter denitrificans Run_A_D11 TaxID=1400863 RepID=W6ME36_9GAMM|nr:hypothetical protein BN873_720022 [Candidatus Competibacter denitrificans Run_A_D11]